MTHPSVTTFSANWGRCPCTGVYSTRFVEVRLSVGDRVVTLTGVPQGACPQCGSRVYKTNTLRLIESLMKSG